MNDAFFMVVFFVIFLLYSCFLIGRFATRKLFPSTCSVSLRLIIGYALIGLSLFLSRVIFETEFIGIFIIFFLVLISLKLGPYKKHKNQFEIEPLISLIRSNFMSIFLMLSFLMAVIYCAKPLLSGQAGDEYRLIDIYDLPKHIMVFYSLRVSNSWPLESAFMDGYSFIYNVLAYEPIHLYSWLNQNSGTDITQAGILMILSPMLLVLRVYEQTKNFKLNNFGTFVSISAATWASGLLPLIVATPALGYQLYAQGYTQIQNWVDDLFVSVLFVPQHLLSILFFLASIELLGKSEFNTELKHNYLLSGTLLTCSIMSSFVLLPVFILIYLYLLCVLFIREQVTKNRYNLNYVWAILPILFSTLILRQLLNLSKGDLDEVFLASNITDHVFPLLINFPIVVTLIFIVIYSVRHFKRVIENVDLFLHFNVILMLLIAFLFVPYSDGRLKVGFSIRIVIIPIIIILFSYYRNFSSRNSIFLSKSILIFTSIFMVLNLNTPLYFMQNSRIKQDVDTQKMYQFVKEIPEGKRILLLDGNQFLWASIDRNIDFNFLLHRSDGYMPQDERESIAGFWSNSDKNLSMFMSKIRKKYTFVIIPRDEKILEVLKNERFELREFTYYTIVELK